MLDLSDVLIIDRKKPNFEKHGLHTVDYWGGDHRFHHNKANFYNMLGIRRKLYGFSKKDIQNHKYFVIIEDGKAHWVVDDIRRWNPDAKIKFVMVNIVSDYGDWKIREIQKRNVEIFSFDQNDCDEYGLTRYPGFCFYDGNILKRSIKDDVYFIGKDKNRADYILDLKRKLTEYGVRCNFNVVREKSKYPAGDIDGVHFIDYFVSYDDVLRNISESKVILDVVQKDQRGPTMRPFESFFYGKKLLTNNPDVKNLDFYRFGNMVVIENENWDEVIKFIRNPVNEYDEREKERYTIENFVKFLFRSDRG